MMRALVVLLWMSTGLQAQWLDLVDAGVPRTGNGKPNLSAKTPRSQGKPDLTGTWQIVDTPREENERLFGKGFADLAVPGDDYSVISKYFVSFFADFGREQDPIRPEALPILEAHLQTPTENPSTRCLPQGIPRADLAPVPFRIIQTPRELAILYEVDSAFRQVHMDGRKLPVDPTPTWLGYSVGHWDGDTLVVESSGYTDRSWLDAAGHPHSESLKIEERFRRIDYGHMEIEITVNDPVMYTRPVSVKARYTLLPTGSLLETICENEKDRRHMEK